MTKPRFALVGAGVIGRLHGLVMSQLADQLELVAVVDTDRSRAEALAAERGGRAYSSLADALAAPAHDRYADLAVSPGLPATRWAAESLGRVVAALPVPTASAGSPTSSTSSRSPWCSSRTTWPWCGTSATAWR